MDIEIFIKEEELLWIGYENQEGLRVVVRTEVSKLDSDMEFYRKEFGSRNVYGPFHAKNFEAAHNELNYQIDVPF